MLFGVGLALTELDQTTIKTVKYSWKFVYNSPQSLQNKMTVK